MFPALAGWTLFAISVVWILPSVLTLALRRLPRAALRPADAAERPQPARTRPPGLLKECPLPLWRPFRLKAVPRQWPPVSIVVAARDEGLNIRSALQSMLKSRYPRLELIAVDDRSADATGAIIDQLAEVDPRVQPVHVSELPHGWLGKNHAMHIAAQRASGEYLLFTDGDVVFSRETIRDAISYMQSRELDHLCLMPCMLPGGFFENSIVAFFGFAFCAGIHAMLIPTRLRFAYCGVGAFNLVRRAAYEAAGGHLPIRMDVLDDVRLGKLLKRSGFRQDFLSGTRQVSVRWQDSTWSVIRGLEKNAFASLDYSVLRLLLVTVMWIVIFIVPCFAAALTTGAAVLGFAAHMLVLHLAYGLIGAVSGAGWRVVVLLLISSAMMAFAFWRSAWVTLRTGGVTWRDSFYPLDELRAGLYR